MNLIRLFILYFCICTAAFSQTNRGAIRGMIRDTSGAIVLNAQIQCQNIGTAQTITTQSSANGDYSFLALIPGEYALTVEANGFKRTRSDVIQVFVGDVTRVDLQLQLGTVSETVLVSDSASLVQPDSVTGGTVLTGKEYDNLPLAAVSRLRIPTDFALLTPGVLGGQQRPGQSQTATTSLSIDGSAPGSVDVLVDGMSSGQINSFGSFTEVAVPVDAIQEFNIMKGAFSAEYGYVRTGLMNFSLKSGTNQYHGSLFENFRNKALNARSFFESRKLPFTQNNFGGTIGGPVWIPRVYNGKDRTFFMFSSDNSIFRGTSQVVVYTSPTEAMLRGDFSGLRTATGQTRAIYDPATTAPDGKGGFTRQPFAGNVIPTNRIDPASAQIAALYPKPNLPGPDSNLVGRGGATFLNNYAFNTKVDHRITDRHFLSVSFNYTDIPRKTNSNPYENTPLLNGLNQIFSSKNSRATYTATLSPTVLNVLQVGLNRWVNNVRSFSYGEDWPSRLGIKGVGGDGSMPVFAFSSDSYSQISSTRWDANVEQNFQVRDTLTLIRGRHTIKTGFEIRHQSVTTRNWQNQNGTFSFSFLQTALNAGSQTGNSFASFLLGQANQGSISTPLHVSSIRPYYAGFIQDDIKLGSRLTMNLGLRYDLDRAPYEQYDRASIFDLNAPNPAAGNRPGALAFMGEGQGRIGRRSYENLHKANFAPRVGLAYQLSRGTVLRAGYGLSYSSNGLLNDHLGFTTTANFQSLDQGATPAFLLRDGMPTEFPRPPFTNPSFGNGNNVTSSIQNETARMPATHLWRFDIQQELSRSILFEIGYVGTRGLHLSSPGLRQLNQVPSQYLLLGSVLNANINSAAAQQAGIVSPYDGFSGPVRQALRPYPQVQNITSLQDKLGSSMYHALETRVQKRFSSGMQFLVSYTLSKNMTDVQSGLAGISSSAIQDAENRKAEWAVAAFDTPHNLWISTIYELPFGAGKRFLSSPGAARFILGGWSVSGVLTYQSGVPLRINQTNRLALFNAGQRPDRIAGAEERNDISYSNFDPATDRLFNPAAFGEVGADSFGNASPRLSNVRDFGVRREDVSLRKSFSFAERFRFELNAQAFNVLNRNQWGTPNDNISSSNFGKISLAGPGRFVQFGLKLLF